MLGGTGGGPRPDSLRKDSGPTPTSAPGRTFTSSQTQPQPQPQTPPQTKSKPKPDPGPKPNPKPNQTPNHPPQKASGEYMLSVAIAASPERCVAALQSRRGRAGGSAVSVAAHVEVLEDRGDVQVGGGWGRGLGSCPKARGVRAGNRGAGAGCARGQGGRAGGGERWAFQRPQGGAKQSSLYTKPHLITTTSTSASTTTTTCVVVVVGVVVVIVVVATTTTTPSPPSKGASHGVPPRRLRWRVGGVLRAAGGLRHPGGALLGGEWGGASFWGFWRVWSPRRGSLAGWLRGK